jgi:hypothetical protein
MLNNRQVVNQKLNTLIELGYTESKILELIIENYMSGSEALEAIEFVEDELGITNNEVKE